VDAWLFEKIIIMNYLLKAKFDVMKAFNSDDTFPEHLKAEVRPLIEAHFSQIGQLIGIIQLSHIRAIQHNDEFNRDGTLISK